MNKVPFSYLPTGSYLSGQAFTFAPGTFIQAGTIGADGDLRVEHRRQHA